MTRARAWPGDMSRDPDLDAIEAFADALWLERGLSENTLAAYRSDLRAFTHWLGRERHRGLCDARRSDLLDYLAVLARSGRKPRSAARLLSCLRQFYGHLLRQGRISEDPSNRVDPPRLGRPLPKTLTEQEVEALLLELAALEASVGPLWSLRYREVLLLDALGRPRDALRALEEADRAFPGHWFLATELDRRQTEWGAREANLESARDRYREDPSLAHLEKLARALAEVQELERAEARYRELLAREPNDAMALLDLAEVSNASNEVAAARGFVDRVLALPAPGSRALCRAGRILAVQLADRAAGREALSRCARAGRSLDEVETLLLQAQARG